MNDCCCVELTVTEDPQVTLDIQEQFIDGGGGITPTGTKTIEVGENGTITEDVTYYASVKVETDVPNTYAAADEGKVVQDGDLEAQTTATFQANDTYDTTTIKQVTVDVPASAVDSGYVYINENDTHDVTGYAQAVVAVPNTYTASDEGKVVDDGELVAQGSATYTLNSTYDTTLISSVTVNVSGGGTPTLQTKSVSYTPTESQQTEQVTADQGYDALQEVDITVGAVSSTYVGSGITRRDDDDLTASGPTVSVPAGYYESSASKAVASGTAGTPTATKGAVSNHSVSVTPSVTNSAGYIASETKTGTAVTVSASELVSGTKSITANGTGIDVTNYAAVDVAVSGGGGISVDDIATNSAPSGAVALGSGVTSVEAYAFRNKPIASVEGQNVTTIKAGAFQGCSSLLSAEFPNVTNITGADVFRDCSALASINLYKLASISSSYTFGGCSSLHTGVFPLLTSQNQSLRSSGFHALDFGSVLSIGNYTFSSSSNLDTLIFRANQIYPLTNIGGLSGTPFANGGTGGTIYIPKSLYDHLGDNSSSDYKHASNWSTVDGYGTITWAKIEGSYYETHYADGTLIS